MSRGGDFMRMRCFAIALLTISGVGSQVTWAEQPAPQEGNFVSRDFKFKSGEALPAIRLHYMTFGTPARDAQGRVTNAVLILHGTGGSGRNFLAPQFADELFGSG